MRVSLRRHSRPKVPKLNWANVSRREKLWLYSWSLAGVWISMASVAWVSGDLTFFVLLMIGAGLGHIVSGFGTGDRVRLGAIVYLAVAFAVWTMYADLYAAILGGSLFPWAKLLAVVQLVVSFNLRSLRSLYDMVLLGLAVVLLAGEGALSTQFVGFLLLFGLVALATMASAHIAELRRGLLDTTAGGWMRHGMVTLGVAVIVFAGAVGAFALIPQSHRVQDAGPLPSRLDLSVGSPPSIDRTSIGESAPRVRALPSRNTESGQTLGSSEETGTQARSSSILATEVNQTPSSAPVSRQTLGYTGEGGGQVVMYVRSPLASYWRGQVLDDYDGRGWLAADRPPGLLDLGDGRASFPETPPWTGKTKSYTQTFYLEAPQPHAIFTGYSPGVIVLPADEPAPGSPQGVGALQVSGATYKVISAVPVLTPQVLQKDRADGSYLSSVRPLTVPLRIEALARQIVEGANTDFEMAARLEQYLLTNFDYDLRVSPLTRSDDVVDDFLFHRQAGYCSQFATAMAVMARSIGLPARVAIGYLPGSYDRLSGVHTVRLQDAHAWVEIKFLRSGWVPFDPTPRPDSPWALDAGFAKATSSLQDVLRTQIKDITAVGPSYAAGGLSTLQTGLTGLGTNGVLPGTGLALVFFLAVMVARRLRERGWEPAFAYSVLSGDGRMRVRKTYAAARRVLRRKGYPSVLTAHSPQEYLDRLERLGIPLPETFQEISRAATQALYNPQPLDGGLAAATGESMRTLRKTPKLLHRQNEGQDTY